VTARRLAGLLAVLLLASPAAYADVEQFNARVLERKAQSRDHFVQGLEIHNGQLYVGTGTYGGSGLFRYDFGSGALLDARPLDRRIFGEGVTVLGDRVYQLTWRNRAMLVYDRQTLEPLGRYPLPGEGWGLTNDGEHLWYSDGSDRLHRLDPDDGRRLHTLRVTERGRPLRALNELEWIDGRIWANVWRSERVVIIDPISGEVTGSVDLRGLLRDADRRRDTDVLNGIALDPATGGIWVTGKRWPWLFRIEPIPVQETPPAR
jgi:glutamine cyclotransferase